MLNTYQIRVLDWNGAVVGIFAGSGKSNDSLASITCSRYINQIGQHQLIFQGNLSQFEAWKLDYQIEILRHTVNGWAKVYHGFHRTSVYQADEQGLEQFISYGHDLNGLIARATIPSDTVSALSVKAGSADDVIKAYVNENAGPLAGVSRARLGLTIQANTSAAPTWSGSQARQQLFDAMREIALSRGVDFDTVNTGQNAFEFRTYYPRLGTDRTINNAGGLKPVIFSLEHNNMATPVMSENHGSEINAIYVLGQGEEADRDVVLVTDGTSIIASPWNRIEAVREAGNIAKGNLTDLAYYGAKELQANQAYKSGAFTAIQTDFSTYNVHYFDGDIVTGLYHMTLNKRIVGVEFNVGYNSPQESIRLELSDVS